MSASQPLLTFVIPIMHPDNARDWESIKRYLSQAANAIAAQTHPSWNAVVVANRGSDLPPLPPKMEVVWVDLPANARFARDGAMNKEDWYDSVRLDKGRRLLAGFAHAGRGKYLMVMDGDDLVSNRLVEYVAANDGGNGWRIDKGYVWNDGGKLLYRSASFSTQCGSSHIIRCDLYGIPQNSEAASDEYIKRMLGSHRFIDAHLASVGTPLASLPFVGAVYRVAHGSSHSQTPGIMRQFFLSRKWLRRPWVALGHIFKLRMVNTQIRSEFSVS